MDFKKSPSGKVIKAGTGYDAFIPNPLPPNITLTPVLIKALSNADFLLGKLAREGARLSDPHLLIRPFITKEAVFSSKIEGTQATIGEVLANDAGVSVDRDVEDIKEVKNYIVALEYAIERLQTLPLSLRFIREIHKKLMQGVRGVHATPGEFRKSQNWIGVAGSDMFTAKYVPPTPDVLMQCLGDLELFLQDRSLPTLVHSALVHYQFEAIHPFLDGNGRVGRLLIALLLIERNILSAPLLYLSAFFESTRDEYYRYLYSVSAHGQWHDWLLYFFNGVATQSADALSRSERINKLIVDWHAQVEQFNSSSISNIVAHLAANPFVTITKAAERLDVAYTTAQRALQKLELLHIVVETTQAKRDRVYCAQKILDILEEPAKF